MNTTPSVNLDWARLYYDCVEHLLWNPDWIRGKQPDGKPKTIRMLMQRLEIGARCAARSPKGATAANVARVIGGRRGLSETADGLRSGAGSMAEGLLELKAKARD